MAHTVAQLRRTTSGIAAASLLVRRDHDVLIGQHGRRERGGEARVAKIGEDLVGREPVLGRRAARGIKLEVDDRDRAAGTQRPGERAGIRGAIAEVMPDVDDEDAIDRARREPRIGRRRRSSALDNSRRVFADPAVVEYFGPAAGCGWNYGEGQVSTLVARFVTRTCGFATTCSAGSAAAVGRTGRATPRRSRERRFL
jgi:hypothetical protein